MYTNKQIFNDGIRFQGQVPADDRTYIDSLSDLYITPATQTSSALYGRAYKGLIVVVGTSDGSDANILVCKKATPYNPGSTESVSATNYLTYWRDITDKTKMVDASRGIKVIQDKFTGTLWKINKIANPATGVFASYALAAMAPDGNSYVNVSGSAQIDIPELEVVDDVHVCKATYDAATHTYTETARQGDPNWDTAAGDVYLHIVWNTKDDDSDPTDDKSSETYIKVSDMISVDVTDLQRQIDDVSTRLKNQITKEENDVNALNKRIADVSTDVSTLAGYVNTTISQNVNTLQTNINSVSTNLSNTSTALNNSISDLSSNLNNEISDVSSDLRELINTKTESASTYFSGIISDVSSRLDEQITKESNDVSGITGRLNTLDVSYGILTTTVNELTDHLNASVAEAVDAYRNASNALDDVSTQEMVMAAAIIKIREDISTLHNGYFGAGAMTLDLNTRKTLAISKDGDAEVTTEEPNDYDYVISEVDMTPLFEAEVGAEASVDLRTINTIERYIIKNNIKIEIEITFKEDTDNIVFYYDYMDATSFKREFVEIGMNDESSLVILNKKTVKLCKI